MGREAVIDRCDKSAKFLETVSTTITKLKINRAETFVVMEGAAQFQDQENCSKPDHKQEDVTMKGSMQHLNPDGLHKNPAYSQAVVVSGAVKTIYVGGQNGVDAAGKIVGKGDIKAQTEQALMNVETALAAGGAKLEHVVKWNVYIVQGQPLLPGFEAFQRAWGERPNPPAVTGVFVAGLAHPDFLVEIDAIAVVPQD